MDLNLLKTEEGVKLLKESQRKRFKNESVIDTLVEINKQIFLLNQEIQKCGAKQNKLTKEIKDTGSKKLVEEARAIVKEVGGHKDKIKEYMEERNKLSRGVGSLVHESVPVSKDEKDNQILRTWGKPLKPEESVEGQLHSHYDLMPKLGLVDGTDVAGGRTYYLTGSAALLQFALTSYCVQFLQKENYTMVIPPYFMKGTAMEKVAQLEQFKEELYSVEDGDSYLIATSEQPLAALHADSILPKKSLPIKYMGHSPCFRKEVGAHGKDTRGIFRVHQFDKVEQFCITENDKSWEMQEQMLAITEKFYQSLNIPYRVVNIVSGELNNAASRKYDLEGWFPASNTFRELVSCSNCTDYQSRMLNIQYKNKENKSTHVHMLNSTLCALTRTMCILVETYQSKRDNVPGITIPEVLRPFLNTDFIPFVDK